MRIKRVELEILESKPYLCPIYQQIMPGGEINLPKAHNMSVDSLLYVAMSLVPEETPFILTTNSHKIFIQGVRVIFRQLTTH